MSCMNYITDGGPCQEGWIGESPGPERKGKSRRLKSCALCVIIIRSKSFYSRAAEMEWLADANGAAEEGKQ